MAKYKIIHPDNPQGRLIEQAVQVILAGGVIVYPTDSGYSLGCQLENKKAVERIRQVCNLDKSHLFTLLCGDLSALGRYATVSNSVFRYLKANTPGPYTFILPATKEVPRRLVHPKRKTVGVRVPDYAVSSLLLHELGEPLMSVSLPHHEDGALLYLDWEDVVDQFAKQVDLLLVVESRSILPTTIVDLTSGEPEIIRSGAGAEI